MRDKATEKKQHFSMGFLESEKNCHNPLDIWEKITILMVNLANKSFQRMGYSQG
jgi:hypothetical protein